MIDDADKISRGDDEAPRDPRIVLVCDTETAEFQAISFELLLTIPDALYRLVDNLQQLETDLQNEDYPDLILVIQTWSDEFLFSRLLAIPGIGLSTRLICVTGPWCGGDGRSRQDWPFALRIPLENFAVELRSFADHWKSRKSGRLATPSLPLPWTAGRDEVFAARYMTGVAHTDRPVDNKPRRRLVIDSLDLELRRVWQDYFQKSGYVILDHLRSFTTQRIHQSDSTSSAATHDGRSKLAPIECDVILWDADPNGDRLTNAEIIAMWTRLDSEPRLAKLVVLTGFQTPDGVNRWQSLGASAVVSKLLPLSALCAEVERISHSE